MTRSYRDWVRHWRRHSSTEWPRGTGQLLHEETGLDRGRNGVAQMSRFRLIIEIRKQFGASEAVNTGWHLGTWMRRKTISIILQRDAKRKSINLSCNSTNLGYTLHTATKKVQIQEMKLSSRIDLLSTRSKTKLLHSIGKLIPYERFRRFRLRQQKTQMASLHIWKLWYKRSVCCDKSKLQCRGLQGSKITWFPACTFGQAAPTFLSPAATSCWT